MYLKCIVLREGERGEGFWELMGSGGSKLT